MAASALLGIFEATNDLNTALDECLLAGDDLLKTDVILRLENELKDLLEAERSNLHREPADDLIERQLAIIEELRAIGEKAANLEVEADQKLQIWQPRIDELQEKEKERAEINELLLAGKRFLRCRSIVIDTLSKSFSSWETKTEVLLEFLRISNSLFPGSRFHQWTRAKAEMFVPAMKTELELEIQKALKTIKWPIAEDKFDSPAASSLCRAVASLVKLQVTYQEGKSENMDQTLHIHANEVVSDLWSIQQLCKPSILRFQFHFCSDRSTNRVDRPEWFVAFILQSVRDIAPFIERRLQPSLAKLKLKDGMEISSDPDAPIEQDDPQTYYVDALSQVIRILVGAARTRLDSIWSAMQDNEALISHTMDELLVGDRTLGGEFGYGANTRFWPTMTAFFFSNDKVSAWLAADLKFARARLDEILDSKTSWQSLSSVVGTSNVGGIKSNEFTALEEKEFATECSDAVMTMIDALGSRIDLCTDNENDATIRTRFVEEIQCTLIKEFALLVLKRPNVVDRFNTLRPMLETLADWKLKPRYVGIKLSEGKHLGKTLLFGAAARMIAKHASSSVASVSSDHQPQQMGTDNDLSSDAMGDDWVFQPYLNYLQRLLKEEVETESTRVFYAMASAWKDWERKTWSFGTAETSSNSQTAAAPLLEVTQEFCEGLLLGRQQTSPWISKVNPVDRAGLIFALAKRLEGYIIDGLYRKAFSEAGAKQFERDYLALLELFKPFAMTGSKKPLGEKYMPRLSATLRILNSPLEDLRRLRDGDFSAISRMDPGVIGVDVRTIASLRIGA